MSSKLGIIGLGHMGFAIAKGAVEADVLKAENICCFSPGDYAKQRAAENGFCMMKNASEVCDNSQIVLLAVRPNVVDSVLEEIKNVQVHCLASVAAGISIAHIKEFLPATPVIRIMPNIPLELSEGASALAKSENCSAEDFYFVFELFYKMGIACKVEEKFINQMVAVNGSTPAYVYYIVDCLVKDAVSRGMAEADARKLVVQTVIGSAKMLVEKPDTSCESFVTAVATPGGATIEAIESFNRDNLPEILHRANKLCIKKAEELGS
ncbi:MAG: pyrroline-5-carboxylate reductase [Eggerthellaceae bacterium]|nr:pyrroline-5-carboxylate reductase [Eggerthellaceae bacterium]